MTRTVVNRGALFYLLPLLLFVAALFQSTLTTRMRILGVKPELVLILVAVGAMVYGAKPGLLWALLGGVFVDLFSGGPMGSSSLALTGVALLAGLGHTMLSRHNVLVPIFLTVVGTFLYSLVYIAVLNLLAALGTITILQAYPIPRIALPLALTLQTVALPVALYNGLIIFLLTPLLNRLSETVEVEF